jgi:hypothetical protein
VWSAIGIIEVVQMHASKRPTLSTLFQLCTQIRDLDMANDFKGLT